VAAAGAGRGQPGAGPLPNKVAFKLGQGREHVEDELATGGGGVDRLLDDLELWLLVGGGDAGIAEQMAHAEERRRTL
jgi:hypothetical protein